MIIEGIFKFITGIINLIPFELPSLPDGFMSLLDQMLTGITSSLGLVDLFIDLRFWLSCAGVMVLIMNIKHLWNTFVYLLNLIPSVNITPWK